MEVNFSTFRVERMGSLSNYTSFLLPLQPPSSPALPPHHLHLHLHLYLHFAIPP
jgi:hypothetical protein